MAKTKLLGNAIPGQPSLTTAEIKAYLDALQTRTPESDEVLKKELQIDDINAYFLSKTRGILDTLYTRYGNLYGLAVHMTSDAEAYRDPGALGFANALIMSLNMINGSTATESELKHNPPIGFTHFNPMAVKTRPHEYYVHKTKGSRYHLLGPVDVDVCENAVLMKNIETGKYYVLSIDIVKDTYEKKTLNIS